MKKGIIIAVALVAIFALCSSAFAAADVTDYRFFHRHGFEDNDSFVDRYSEYDQRMELGLMADVILYEDKALGIPYAVGVQSQYDFSNTQWGFYTKVSLNLSPMIKNGVKSLLGMK